MDYARLQEIDELFRGRWEAFTLAALADAPGPLRYRELLRAVRASTGSDLNDTTITRILKRLSASGMITHNRAWLQSTYALTDTGRAAAKRLDALVQAMRDDQQTSANADSPPTPTADQEVEQPPPEPREIRDSLTALLRDINDAADPPARNVITAAAWLAVAEHALALAGRWNGNGSSLLRELRAHDDGLAQRWLAAHGDPDRTIALIHELLDRPSASRPGGLQPAADGPNRD